MLSGGHGGYRTSEFAVQLQPVRGLSQRRPSAFETCGHWCLESCIKGCRRGFSIPHTNCGMAASGSFHNPLLPMVASRQCWKKRGDRDSSRRLRVRSQGCLVRQRASRVILRYAETLRVKAFARGWRLSWDSRSERDSFPSHTVEVEEGISEQNYASRHGIGGSHGQRAETAQAAQGSGLLYAGCQFWKWGEEGSNAGLPGRRELRPVPEKCDLHLSGTGRCDVGLIPCCHRLRRTGSRGRSRSAGGRPNAAAFRGTCRLARQAFRPVSDVRRRL